MAKVRFVSSSGLNKVIEIKVGSNILETALKNNIDIPNGCGYGSCYSCSSEVIKGIENIECPIVKKELKGKNVTILTCISKIKKDSEIVIKV